MVGVYIRVPKEISPGSALQASTLSDGVWHCVANVYNGTHIQAFVNGTLDTTAADTRNPLKYPDPAQGFPTGGTHSITAHPLACSRAPSKTLVSFFFLTGGPCAET